MPTNILVLTCMDFLCGVCVQVSSYGGYLRYRLHTQTMRGDAFLPGETSRPDVILKVEYQGVKCLLTIRSLLINLAETFNGKYIAL